MSADAIRQVIESLEAVPPTIEGNREMLAWLRGERQMYDETERCHRRVQVVDFETPAENLFHVTWEWRLKRPARNGNRADVMFVVNGVPVAIVEHKNPKDGNAIEHGVSQLRRYEEETPELRDHIDTYRRLAELYAIVRNAHADNVNYLVDLASKTSKMIERSASQRGLVLELPSVTFDVHTIKSLQDDPGSEEAKVFNLVRGLKGEMETNPEMAPVLQTLAERANRILEDCSNR